MIEVLQYLVKVCQRNLCCEAKKVNYFYCLLIVHKPGEFYLDLRSFTQCKIMLFQAASIMSHFPNHVFL